MTNSNAIRMVFIYNTLQWKNHSCHPERGLPRQVCRRSSLICCLASLILLHGRLRFAARQIVVCCTAEFALLHCGIFPVVLRKMFCCRHIRFAPFYQGLFFSPFMEKRKVLPFIRKSWFIADCIDRIPLFYRETYRFLCCGVKEWRSGGRVMFICCFLSL